MASIFTKIINGEIPCYKIAENERFFSFLDINPVSKGHTLVIPKKEIDYLFDLEDADLGDLMVFAKSVARAIDVSLAPMRTGVLVDGREVPHAHVHLIPIYGEKQKTALGEKIEMSKEEMARLAGQIGNAWEPPL
ncbi:MAG: HIT domain-containing protein [Balneolaceae bacterium]|nr:MAG: HIT domain-containing protein [Balneolaceae bacterium]